jgi:methylated-DNA-[protein]-cysteine S-methyltransferase
MIYASRYKSPIGNILLASDEEGLTGLWFEGQKYFANTLPDERILQETEILREAKKWLDLYFTGEEPPFTPPLHPAGSTFRQAVWKILLQIPYGQTITYGEIARKVAEMKNTSYMSAQAVGGAVGHNEISVIIPCHRVVGTNGSLTGYAGGIDKKIALLELEHIDINAGTEKKTCRRKSDEEQIKEVAVKYVCRLHM